MIPGWNNTDTFKRHIKAMESFRHAHADLHASEQEKTAKEIETIQRSHYYTPEGNIVTDENGHVIVIPIGNVEMPGGSQN